MATLPFILTDDNQFIRTLNGSNDIHVFEHKDGHPESDPNHFEMIHTPSSTAWNQIARVSPSDPSCHHRKLKVLGVTIHGYQLTELAKDLTITDNDDRTFHLMVNRRGLCFLEIENENEEEDEDGDDLFFSDNVESKSRMTKINRLRINDRFSWSKYGVEPEVSTIWNVCDMDNGAVLVVGSPTMGGTTTSYRAEEDREVVDNNYKRSSMYNSWKKLKEEKDKVMEKMELLLMKSLLLDEKKE